MRDSEFENMNPRLLDTICTARRKEAEEAIQRADVGTLKFAQGTRLIGDWRRAAVAKRIKQLEKQC